MLYVFLFIAAIIFFLVLWKPFYGLVLVIVSLQFEYFLPSADGWSSGRIIGVMIVFAWILRIMTGKSKFFVHKDVNWLVVTYLLLVTVGVLAGADWSSGASGVVKLAILIVMAFMIQDLIESRRQLIVLAWAIAVSYGLSAVPAILQFRGMTSGAEVVGVVRLQEEGYRFAGLYSNPNQLALMLVAGVPFLVLFLRQGGSWYSRSAYAAILAMVLFSGTLTASRTFAVALFAFIGVYLVTELRFRTFGKAEIVAVLFFLLIGIATIALVPEYALDRLVRTSDSSLHGRFGLFKKGFILFGQHPLLGVGLGNAALHEPMKGANMHDTVSVVVGETGLLGTILILAICTVTMVKQGRTIRWLRSEGDTFLLQMSVITRAAFLALLLCWFGDIIFLRRIFWIYIALSTILSHAQEYGLLAKAPEPSLDPAKRGVGGHHTTKYHFSAGTSHSGASHR